MKTRFFLWLMIIFSLPAMAQLKKGNPAPEIRLPDSAGQAVSLSQLRGKIVLIDFWASWCVPCRRNNPKLLELYKKYHQQGLEILGVSLDENPHAWQAAVDQDKLEWIQVIDREGWESRPAAAYGVDAIPAAFLLDSKGVIRLVNPTHRELESTIKTLLKE